MPVVVPQVVPGVTVEGSVTQLSADVLMSNYLHGLRFVDAEGNEVSTDFYQQKLNAAIAEFERITKVHVLRRTITDEAHDYYVNDYQLFAFFQLHEYPVVSVEKVSAIYPTGQFLFEFPLEWVRLRAEHGQLQLVPTQGTLSQVILGRGGSYLPLLYAGMGYLPQLFRVNYTSGFADGKIPHDIVNAIFKMATINVLSVLGITVFPPGVTNISAGIDGVSQGVGIMNNGQLPPVFAGTVQSYRTELYGDGRTQTGQLKDIADHFRGLVMTVI
jgi:hypothetical protein